MSGQLTTHVLDIAGGRPAVGMKVRLIREGQTLAEGITNADGRLDEPLIPKGKMSAGEYRIDFAVGEYFAWRGHADARRFLDVVQVVFIVDDPSRSYHVPLLVSPWSYSTYRGS